MPTDPKGTTPQPVPTVQTLPEVNMKCRRPGCESITAVQLPIGGGGGQRLYRCSKCMFSWGLNVGGHIDI